MWVIHAALQVANNKSVGSVMKVKWLVILFGCWITVSGCTVKLVYNQLDWMIPWYLDDYLPFTNQQQAILEQHINHQLRWHRETQLPHYALWLRQLRDDWQDGLDLAELENHQVLLKAHWNALLQQLIPDSAPLLATITDAQIDALLVNMAQANEEYYDEHVAPDIDELRENRFKRMEKLIKRWVGEITTVQEQLLADCNDRLHLVGEERLAYRRQWQSAFQQLLERRHEPNLDGLLSSFITDQTHSRPATYQRKFDANETLTQLCILAMDDLMTDRQRDNLLENISELADDLDELVVPEKHLTD
jgi:hypothetical protein